jgi:glycosyltransferase involved in cell wall biosynthesis
MLQKQDILKQLAFLGNTNISDKLYVIPVGGVDRVPKARHLSGDAIRFVTASRLHAEKNISHIILALAQLQANGISATLTIYGSGADEQNIRRLIYDEQMTGSVKINGLSQNLSEELQAYDAFVSASYSEGFGLTYVEAMAQGLPIVSYQNSYGAQTLIRPNENGILVPITDDKDKNVAALARAMRRLLTVYDTLSIGQQNVAKAFTNQQISTAWEKLVGDLR